MTRSSIACFSSSLCAAGDESPGAWAAVVERRTAETQRRAAQRNSVDARIVDLTEGISVTSIELRFRVRVDCCIVGLASGQVAQFNRRLSRCPAAYGLGLSAGFCCPASAVQGGTIPFTRA